MHVERRRQSPEDKRRRQGPRGEGREEARTGSAAGRCLLERLRKLIRECESNPGQSLIAALKELVGSYGRDGRGSEGKEGGKVEKKR